MTGRHYLAFGPYDHPQEPPEYARAKSVQLVEVDGVYVRHPRAPGVTPASAALNELVGTMQAITNLYDEAGEMLTDDQHDRLNKLDDRQAALEKQLEQLVREQLGIDYTVLWHAVTPSGPTPKLP